MKQFKTYYDDLGVAQDASPELIRAAYRALAQKWHPDRSPEPSEASETITRRINVAYQALSDPARRREHDAWINAQRPRDPPTQPPRAPGAQPTVFRNDYGPVASPRPSHGGRSIGWMALALAFLFALLVLAAHDAHHLLPVLAVWLGAGGCAFHALSGPGASGGHYASAPQLADAVRRRKAAGAGWMLAFLSYPLMVAMLMLLGFPLVSAVMAGLAPAAAIGIICWTVAIHV